MQEVVETDGRQLAQRRLRGFILAAVVHALRTLAEARHQRLLRRRHMRRG